MGGFEKKGGKSFPSAGGQAQIDFSKSVGQGYMCKVTLNAVRSNINAGEEAMAVENWVHMGTLSPLFPHQMWRSEVASECFFLDVERCFIHMQNSPWMNN